MSERGNTDKRRVADLAPWEDNPRAMTPEARERLERSMAKFGDLSGVVFNRRTGRLVGGHQRRAHLPEDAEVQVVERWEEPNEVGTVAVGWIEVGGERWGYREVDVDERREKAMNIAANQHRGEFVDDLLAPMVDELHGEYDLGLMGFEKAEGDRLLDLLGGPVGNPEPPPAEDPPENPVSERGEIYELGPHRLMCGDATNPEDVERLLDGAKVDMVFTDPPFAIYGSSSGLSSSVTDDKIVRPFFRDALQMAQRATDLFAPVYVCCDWRSWPSWWEVAKRTRLEPKNLLVWDKGGGGLGNNWANTHELIGYFVHMPEQKTMKADRPTGIRPVLKPNILRHPRPRGDERKHNAAKAMGLVTEILKAGCDRGGSVLDLFGGSGTTLLAAHRAGRVCYMMEIDPGFCDLIRARYEREAKETGGQT